VCLYRSIAEQLPRFDAFVFHGAAVNIDGAGFIFTAPSGTGKTTHVKLLMENYPDRVSIINGDKPVIRFYDDGVYVCSTPWAGKEDMKNNTRAKLRGICILRRSKSNSIRRIEPSTFFSEIIHQVYLPVDSNARENTLEMLNMLGTRVNFYLLECNISHDAAQTSFGELSKS
jgi:serine kinase of HPr protein (carbohydrate metabolism regulator)